MLPGSVGTWIYHDHARMQRIGGSGDPVMELGAQLGLFGFIVITEPGETPADRELFVFFHDVYQDDVGGQVSQDFDCFNGAAYLGNTPTYQARPGERVRWHLAALGREFHVFHLHGHRWRDPSGRPSDTVALGPSMATSIDFVEDNPGRWLYHCHVTDHMAGGMVGAYVVNA